MCGILGYVGDKNVENVLIEGLKRMEYRGYDSSGITFFDGEKFETYKAVGRIINLEKVIDGHSKEAKVYGICHTRWATHGQPSEENAHPHTSCDGKISLVHNGIIENYQEIKAELIKKGHKFKSETDSEVIVHLIEELYKGNLLDAVQAAMSKVRGAYGIAVMSASEPGRIVAARMGSPLILGIGKNENFVASDVSAFLGHTKQVVYLNDGEIADIQKNDFELYDTDNQKIDGDLNEVEWSLEESEKGGYPHFMLKEIMEQPEVIRNSTRGRILLEDGDVMLGGLRSVEKRLREIERILIIACGTARLASLVGEYMLEEYAGIPVEVEYASEFRYRNPIISKKNLCYRGQSIR